MLMPLFAFGILDNLYSFLFLMILIGGGIGFLSRSLAVASFGAFLVFIYIAQNAEIVFFTNFLYLVLVLLILTLGFKLWEFYTGEPTT